MRQTPDNSISHETDTTDLPDTIQKTNEFLAASYVFSIAIYLTVGAEARSVCELYTRP